MPPVLQPVPSQILSALTALLALPDAGADYFYKFNVVKVGADIFNAGVYPAVTIGIGEIGQLLENRDGRVMFNGNYHWNLSAIVALEGVVAMHDALICALHDVHKALMSDGQGGRLGGIAKTTQVTGAWFLPPQSESDPICWVEIGFEVHFRTKEQSMLEAT